MTTHKKPGCSINEARAVARAREGFVEVCGWDACAARRAEIDALPAVEWKGHRLRTIRCNGTTGRGPHLVNVPDSLLWSLIRIGEYVCPFHR